MAHTKTTAKPAATTRRRSPAAPSSGSVADAIVEIRDGHIIIDRAKLDAIIKAEGGPRRGKSAGMVKVGFPVSYEDYKEHEYDQ
jgi:hypothetical protein